jgi:hypothetical protein
MDEQTIDASNSAPEEVARRPRRRFLTGIACVTLIAALAALGLSIYNTARFDDRVRDYVSDHRAALAGVQGPRGAPGTQGPAGPAGPIGLPGKTPDLAAYNTCVQFELNQWMERATVTLTTDAARQLAAKFNLQPLLLACQ